MAQSKFNYNTSDFSRGLIKRGMVKWEWEVDSSEVLWHLNISIRHDGGTRQRTRQRKRKETANVYNWDKNRY